MGVVIADDVLFYNLLVCLAAGFINRSVEAMVAGVSTLFMCKFVMSERVRN